ncbi:uncharacterized protein LOC120840380 [Ixodes scapularis]|uniref:uncharacterized protein LOC120840380 n=1 Tax=Ixodes scapularis TaxID=6945 RepID=UPI001A9D4A40|nr:uncharacterized protein LOC120840380 [Ixodes scapularis]
MASIWHRAFPFSAWFRVVGCFWVLAYFGIQPKRLRHPVRIAAFQTTQRIVVLAISMAHPLPHQIPNDAKPYHIVHFSDDSTFVVPEWWLDRSGPNLVAFWPPYSTKEQLVQVVQRRDKITQDWSVHPARILHSCATLQQALDGIDEEEDTSSLESDSPQQPVRKRSKPRRLFDHGENRRLFDHGEDRPPAEPQQSACFRR